MGNRACIYIRRSKQTEERWSLESQEQRAREFAQRHELEVLQVYEDIESGYVDSRQNFQEMLIDAFVNKFDVLIVTHTSRLFRNALLAEIYEEWMRERLGIQVLYVEQPDINNDDPLSKMLKNVFRLFDELFLTQLSSWVRAGKKAKVEKGFHHNPLALGYTISESTGEAVPEATAAEIVRLIFERFATDQHSLQDVADDLNKLGHETRQGFRFTSGAIWRILTNRFYLGEIRYHGEYLTGNHDPIIDEKLFNQCQEMLAKRERNQPQKKHHFILRGVVRCSKCQYSLVGQNKQGKIYYCHQDSKRRSKGNCQYGNKNLPSVVLEKQWAEILCSISICDDWQNQIKQFIPAVVRRDAILHERRKVEGKLAYLKTSYLELLIDEDVFNIKYQALQEQLCLLEVPPAVELDRLLSFSVFWLYSTIEEKNQLTQLLLNQLLIDVETGQITAVELEPVFRDLLQGEFEARGIEIIRRS